MIGRDLDIVEHIDGRGAEWRLDDADNTDNAKAYRDERGRKQDPRGGEESKGAGIRNRERETHEA
jgi:hypothetical protein